MFENVEIGVYVGVAVIVVLLIAHKFLPGVEI